MKHLIPLALLALLVTGESRASSDEVTHYLRRFRANPRQATNEPPLRWDETGRRVAPAAPGELRFPPESIVSGEALAERDRTRVRLLERNHLVGGLAEFRGVDLAEAVTDNGASGILRNLGEMDRRGLRQARLAEQPWSDAHWGYFTGILGTRYADRSFPMSWSWLGNRRYVLDYPASRIAQRGSDREVDELSPSEKYELLIGDPGFGLTTESWKRGQRAFDENGYVERWKGICHGWAAASLMLPRPLKAITLPSADGRRNLRFYPADLKALASQLWADGRSEIRFIGGRCESANPDTDRNGRVIDDDCFDTNPGTWHLAVVNQLGVSRRGLILDSSFDYEVWNQPVRSYSYGYFNPRKMEAVDALQEAIEPLGGWRDDFRRYRSPKAKSVVGVTMDVTYLVKNNATHETTDSPEKDALRTVRYVYDLELNEAGEVIGGEWYQKTHPDFLWVPAPGSRATSDHDAEATESWEPGSPLPAGWRAAARVAAPKLQPLAKIVETLLSQSRRGE